MERNTIIKFHTVGQLKEALKDVPDDTGVMCQTVAVNGDAWNMFAQIVPLNDKVKSTILQLYHPDMLFMHPRLTRAQVVANLNVAQELYDKEQNLKLKDNFMFVLGAIKQFIVVMDVENGEENW